MSRVLVGLDRAGASGTLHVAAQGREARLALRAGAVVGANVDRRVPSSEAKLLDAMVSVCTWSDVVLRLRSEPPSATWWKLREPVRGGALALGLLRAAAGEVEPGTVRADLGPRTYRLTESGETLLRGASLGTAETAALRHLRRGVTADELLSLPGCGFRAHRFLWMLRLAGAVTPGRGGAYPLLLRKRRELRENATAHALLDLPEDAQKTDARRALRKLVAHLHPDRFEDGAPELRRASGEVVAALVTAEATIRSSGAG